MSTQCRQNLEFFLESRSANLYEIDDFDMIRKEFFRLSGDLAGDLAGDGWLAPLGPSQEVAVFSTGYIL